jgi:ankyrin repeat protein
VNHRNKKDRTPLFLAAGAGNLVVSQLLLQHGAGSLLLAHIFTTQTMMYFE